MQLHGTAGPKRWVKAVAQVTQKTIDLQCRGHIALLRTQVKIKRSFAQALAYAVAQLCGGCFGEGHHQNLRWQQSLIAPMAQHQAQIKRGQGPRFARACTGLNHLSPLQRQIQRLQGFHDAASSCCV